VDSKSVISTSGGRLPIEPSTASNWAHETVAEAMPGFQLKRVRSGVETLLAANDINREVRGHLQSHGITGVQYRHYDGHDYMPQKRQALEVLMSTIEPKATAKSKPRHPRQVGQVGQVGRNDNGVTMR
jgi:hypothetical protein